MARGISRTMPGPGRPSGRTSSEWLCPILYNDCGTAEEFSWKAEEFLKEIV